MLLAIATEEHDAAQPPAEVVMSQLGMKKHVEKRETVMLDTKLRKHSDSFSKSLSGDEDAENGQAAPSPTSPKLVSPKSLPPLLSSPSASAPSTSALKTTTDGFLGNQPSENQVIERRMEALEGAPLAARDETSLALLTGSHA